MKKFYIFTFICFAILFTVVIANSKNYQAQPTQPNAQELDQINHEIKNENESELKQANQQIIAEIPTVPIEVSEQTKELEFIKPVNGEIEMNYSPETLIYSKTLGEWKTHNGIDIKAERGTPVKASEEGTISSITETTDKGIEITITHKDGYKTVYSNLSTKSMVAPGQKVKRGQVLSGIGNTASFEYYEPDHLHFEAYKNDILIDPATILK